MKAALLNAHQAPPAVMLAVHCGEVPPIWRTASGNHTVPSGEASTCKVALKVPATETATEVQPSAAIDTAALRAPSVPLP